MCTDAYKPIRYVRAAPVEAREGIRYTVTHTHTSTHTVCALTDL